jgi:hypothetical protein
MPETEQVRKRVNAAERLHRMLSKLRTVNASNTYDAIPGLFSIYVDRERGWSNIQAYALVHDMVTELIREVKSTGMSDEDQEYCLKSVPIIGNALLPLTLHADWKEQRKSITDSLLENLAGTSMFLRRYIDEVQLWGTDLDRLSKPVEEAIEAATKLEIPAELKDYLLTALAKIKRAIWEYEHRGIAGIKDSLAGYSEAVACTYEYIERSVDIADDQQHQEAKVTSLNKLSKVLTTATDLIKVAKSTSDIYTYLQLGYEHLIRHRLPH